MLVLSSIEMDIRLTHLIDQESSYKFGLLVALPESLLTLGFSQYTCRASCDVES